MIMIKKRKIFILILAFFLLSFPAFCRGKQKEKNIQNITQIKGSVSDYKTEIINIDWWEKFNDPLLTDYIVKALQANKDVKIAGLRVAEYKQLVKVSLSNEFPSLNIGADFNVQQYSKNYIPLFSGVLQNYTFPLTVSYELDIWKKNWNKMLSSKKYLETIQYDEKAALISIVSEVGALYLNTLKAEKDIKFQKEIVAIKTNRLNLVKEKYNAGVSSYDEVINREKDLTDATVSLKEYEKTLEVLKNALAVLIGESPDTIAEMKFGNIDNLELFSTFTDKIKSDKIFKRPDILKAEAQLQKAKIDVNIARKEFLPDITLTGQAGFNSTSFEKIFQDKSLIYIFGANIANTLFSGGRNTAILKSKKYYYDQMSENYQKTILTSLKEVNDSLIIVKTSSQKNEDYIKKLNLEKENLKLINERYKVGVISYLDTLEPKEKLIMLQKDQLQAKTDYIIDNFSLYKTLGANF